MTRAVFDAKGIVADVLLAAPFKALLPVPALQPGGGHARNFAPLTRKCPSGMRPLVVRVTQRRNGRKEGPSK